MTTHLPRSAAVTVKDVARLAGVSPMTVSRVVNGTSSVAPVLQRKVQEAVDRLGYVPNDVARLLRGGKAGLVAAIFPTLKESIYLHLVEAIVDRFDRAGYQLIVGQTSFHEQEETALVEGLLSRKPDAIIMTGRLHSASVKSLLSRAGIPVIEVWDIDGESPMPNVGLVHEDVGLAVADYFCETGRRAIAYIGADEERSRRRCEALARRASDRGLQPVARTFVPPPTTLRAGREAFREVWRRSKAAGAQVDAVFCSSDIIALGVQIEAKLLGIRMGDQLSLLGFGDFPIARDTCPRISTVRVDTDLLASKILEILARMEAGDSTRIKADVGFTLDIRET